MKNTVIVPTAVQKAIAKFPAADGRRILTAISTLRQDSRPPGCKKLADADLWRVRVGQYRVVYAIDDDAHTVTVVKAAHRGSVYR